MALKRCCCSSDLRSGARAIAIFYLVGTVLCLIGGVLGTMLSLPRFPRSGYPEDLVYYRRQLGERIGALVGTVAGCGLGIAANALLLRGTRTPQASRGPLLFWLVWYGLLSAALTLVWLAVLGLFIHMTVHAGPHSLGLGPLLTSLHAVIGGTTTAVLWYCYAVVVAYWNSLVRSGDRQTTADAPI